MLSQGGSTAKEGRNPEAKVHVEPSFFRPNLTDLAFLATRRLFTQLFNMSWLGVVPIVVSQQSKEVPNNGSFDLVLNFNPKRFKFL